MTRHHVFTLPANLPEAKRRAALDLQVRKAFPFKEPGFAAHWQGAEASVYAWDAARVRAAQIEAGLSPATQVVPETFVRPRGQTGVRLVAMLDGCEGQYWVDGFLRASRWWPAPPLAFEWARFLRAVGLPPPPEADPVPEAADFLERPWTEGVLSLDDWATLLQSRRALGLIAAGALCPFLFFGAQIAVMAATESSVRAEIAALDAANRAVRADRAAAYANLEAIEAFVRLDEFPPHADVLATAVTLLANTGGPRILSWSFDRGNLEVILRGSNELDPTAYITLFERDPLFENVSGTFVGQERDLQLRMAVSKRAVN
jgi:hypothetical protein